MQATPIPTITPAPASDGPTVTSVRPRVTLTAQAMVHVEHRVHKTIAAATVAIAPTDPTTAAGRVVTPARAEEILATDLSDRATSATSAIVAPATTAATSATGPSAPATSVTSAIVAASATVAPATIAAALATAPTALATIAAASVPGAPGRARAAEAMAGSVARVGVATTAIPQTIAIDATTSRAPMIHVAIVARATTTSSEAVRRVPAVSGAALAARHAIATHAVTTSENSAVATSDAAARSDSSAAQDVDQAASDAAAQAQDHDQPIAAVGRAVAAAAASAVGRAVAAVAALVVLHAVVVVVASAVLHAADRAEPVVGLARARTGQVAQAARIDRAATVRSGHPHVARVKTATTTSEIS